MKTIIEKILDRMSLALIFIGLIAGIIGGSDNFQIGNVALHIENNGIKSLLVIAGYTLTILGLIFILLELFKHIKEFGQNKTSNEIVKEEYRFHGSLEDLYLSNDIFTSKKLEFVPISAEGKRLWKYTLTDVTIRSYAEKLSLSFTAEVRRSGKVTTYACTGSGPYHDGVAYIQYEFKPEDKNSNERPWKGVMVLLVSAKEIRGIWLTTKIQGDNRFPIGRIALEL